MRTVIYFGIVGLLLYKGFFTLDENDWQPVELPEVVTNLIEEERIVLPPEDWEKTLIGTWEFSINFSSSTLKGTVTYRDDKTFIRKVSYSNGSDIKSGGTVRGGWSIGDNLTWVEVNKECKSLPDKDICNWFSDTVIYGNNDTDIEEAEMISFNQNRIEFRTIRLSGKNRRVYEFVRVEN